MREKCNFKVPTKYKGPKVPVRYTIVFVKHNCFKTKSYYV